MPHSPLTLRAAAAVQAIESVIVLAATVLAGVDAATGESYHVNSGIALTVIGAAAAAALAWVALGVARARRWSRTPALLTQLFVGIVGIYLLQGHRLDWGVPSVVLAAAGFATLFAPPTMRALTGTEPETGGQQDLPGTPPPAPSRVRKAAPPAGGGSTPPAGRNAARSAGRKAVPATGRNESSSGRKRPAR
jgi:hypothetical protein